MFGLPKITLYRSNQDSEWINSDLSGNICSKENRLSKINLYGSDQDSEQINSDLPGNICSKENRFPKITLYRSDQDSEWINSDLSGNICSKENRLYLKSLFMDLTKILNRSIEFNRNRLNAVSAYMRKWTTMDIAIFFKSAIYSSSLIVGMHVLRTFYKLGKIILEPRGGGC